VPIRIEGLDQRDLPIATPVFLLLLPRDGSLHVAVQFVKNQPFDLMAGGEAFERPATMLSDAAHQVVTPL